jgi:nicotinamidase-related amidase
MLKIPAIVVCALALIPASVLSRAAAAPTVPAPTAKEKVTAFLIIDVQDFYFPGGAVPLVGPEEASRNAAKILEKFRNEGRPVIHVGHNATKGMGFRAEVAPRDGEKIFFKDEVNAFKGTELLPYLREHKVQRLVIVGMQTHMCVEAAVRAASDYGFECILVGDACATRNVRYRDREVNAADVHASTLATLDRTYATVVDTETFLSAY